MYFENCTTWNLKMSLRIQMNGSLNVNWWKFQVINFPISMQTTNFVIALANSAISSFNKCEMINTNLIINFKRFPLCCFFFIILEGTRNDSILYFISFFSLSLPFVCPSFCRVFTIYKKNSIAIKLWVFFFHNPRDVCTKLVSIHWRILKISKLRNWKIHHFYPVEKQFSIFSWGAISSSPSIVNLPMVEFNYPKKCCHIFLLNTSPLPC